ncbi:MAG TPA: lysylphosphatidylglycerol synthase domain-containing protein [Thermoanaerobaculia bacterium]
MKTASWLGLAAGIALAVALVAWQGASTVVHRLASTDARLILVAAFAVPQLLLSTASWRLLFPPAGAPRFALALLALWIGYSINLMLPVASVGGDVVRARLAAIWSGRTRDAVASVVVDKTVLIATLPILFVIGMAAFLRAAPGSAPLFAVGGTVVVLAIALVLLVLVQRAGLFAFLARHAVRLAHRPGWDDFVERASHLDGAIRALYARPTRVAASCALRVLARLSLSGEVWLAARLLGHPISIADAIFLKSFSIVARTAAFAVPAGLGVQEGTFVALGALIGLPPDVALATSLATRVREIVSSVPGLLAWQAVEGRRLWRRRAA